MTILLYHAISHAKNFLCMKLMNIDHCEIQIINPILQIGRAY